MAPIRYFLILAAFSLAVNTALASGRASGDFTDGLCRYEMGGGGLLKAKCAFPQCPTGADCHSPSIYAKGAKIEYFEPLLQWKDTCPSATLGGSCWEVYMDFRLTLGAEDPNGVTALGVNMVQDLEGKLIYKKYWVSTQQKDPSGKFEINGGMVLHVPAGKPLEVSVFQLCARDALGNEGCSAPSTRMEPTAFSKRQK